MWCVFFSICCFYLQPCFACPFSHTGHFSYWPCLIDFTVTPLSICCTCFSGRGYTCIFLIASLAPPVYNFSGGLCGCIRLLIRDHRFGLLFITVALLKICRDFPGTTEKIVHKQVKCSRNFLKLNSLFKNRVSVKMQNDTELLQIGEVGFTYAVTNVQFYINIGSDLDSI